MTQASSPLVKRAIPGVQPRAAGFTLLEMLLVLAILVAITTVTFPVVGRMYDTHRIKRAAMEVRTLLSAARLRAVDEGEAFECHFEPDGRQLVVFGRGDRRIRFGADTSPSAASQQRADGMHLELPRPLSFWTADKSRAPLEAKVLRGLTENDGLSSRTWSAPIVFAPNGSSTDAEFEIRDQEGRAVELEVRGLTGAARVTASVRRDGE